jgi:hypothetical protein
MALEDDVVLEVVAALDDGLRRAPWKGNGNPLVGHCYVASEALFHLLDGVRPQFIRHEGKAHWFLLDSSGRVVDATAGQFGTPVPYADGIGKGFLTSSPSRRAQTVINRVLSKRRGQ